MIKRKKIEHDIESLIPLLVKRLQKEKDVIFAYIFGSRARGKATALSDVDIALFVDKASFSPDRKLELIELLIDLLKTDEIDLVILNDAAPSIVHSVVKDGRLLFSRDEKRRVKFIAQAQKEYMDMEYYRRKYFNKLKERIKEGKFGIP